MEFGFEEVESHEHGMGCTTVDRIEVDDAKPLQTHWQTFHARTHTHAHRLVIQRVGVQIIELLFSVTCFLHT